MKRKYWDWILIVLVFVLAFTGIKSNMATGDDAAESPKKSYSKRDVVIYPIKITKVSSDDNGNFIVKGKTDAPNGSKVLAWVPGDEHVNAATDPYEDKYSLVRNKKFEVAIDASNLSDKENIKANDKGRVKIFAIKNYNELFDDGFITHDLQKAIEKQDIKVSKLTYSKKLADYLKD